MSADPIGGIPYPTRSVASNITATMQATIDYIGARLSPKVRFAGSLGVGVAVTAATNIPFTSTEDTNSAWSGSSWTCPVAGTYLLMASIKNNVTGVATSIRFLKAGAGVYVSPTSPSMSYSGLSCSFYIRLAVGDVIAMQVSVGYTTHFDAPAVNNVFQIVQVQQ